MSNQVEFNIDSWNSAIRALRDGSVEELLELHENGAVSEAEVVGAIAGRCYEQPQAASMLIRRLREYPNHAAPRIAEQVEAIELPQASHWGRTISRWLFGRQFRLIWPMAAFAGLIAFCVWDSIARSRGWKNVVSPTAIDLYISVGLGAFIGVLAAAWERFLMTHRRASQLLFHRSTLRERSTWKYQPRNLRQNGWFVLLTFALLVWCGFKSVFALPALLAMNVPMAMNARLAGEFAAEIASSDVA